MVDLLSYFQINVSCIMENLSLIGKLFVILGVIPTAAGIIIVFHKHTPLLGRLPCDIFIEKKTFSFYFPISSSILLGIILPLFFYFIKQKIILWN